MGGVFRGRASASAASLTYSSAHESERERRELFRFHDLWTSGHGRLLVDKDILVPEMVQRLVRSEPLIAKGSNATFSSPLWGAIDLARLNGAPRSYPGNLGQVELFRDLAIVFRRPRLGITNTRHYWEENANRIFRENGWNNIVVTWRRFLWLHRRIDWSEYRGEQGYDRFAAEHFAGIAQRAWEAANTLLTDDEFAELGWTKAKHVHVEEQDDYRRALRRGLRDRSLIGTSGYDRFASECFGGDSHKAWRVASALLSKDEFAQLRWGTVKLVRVREHAKLRKLLRRGLRDGTLAGRFGYDQFATEHFAGASHKAWRVANALLSKDEFAQLRWGKAKRAPLDNQGAYLQILWRGLADGSLVGKSGYNRFAYEHCGGDSRKAWLLASELLSKDEFVRLQWGKQIGVPLHRHDELRRILGAGLEDGSLTGDNGYAIFASEHFQGRYQVAWQVASALLSRDQFARLKWREGKPIRVREHDRYLQILRRGLRDGSFVGESGYDRFAADHVLGKLQKAWTLAKSVLSEGEFARLEWRRPKQTTLSAQRKYRPILRAGLRDGTLVGEDGYDKFAVDHFQGNSLRAWQVARGVLSEEEFRRLQWGRQKHTHVHEQGEYRRILRRGLRDETLVGEKGYDKFAVDHFQGSSQMAWQVVRALLSEEEFRQLRWGRRKQTNVREQRDHRRVLRRGLRDGTLVGEKAYDQFARHHFSGDLAKAWHSARSLLSEKEFVQLEWGKKKLVNLREQSEYRQVLAQGLRNGRLRGKHGRDRFARQFFRGNELRAWQAASSLLTADEFVRLEWGTQKSCGDAVG